jgi:hypothetical protein
LISKAFVIRVLGGFSACVFLVVVAHIVADPYGLWLPTTRRDVKVYHNERTSKYLMSFRYVPENFDGLLLGPSYSDNVNTAQILTLPVYNGSINGGSMSELALVANNVFDRQPPVVLIVCLTPYITNYYGRKTSFMTPDEKWGSLGSTETLKYWLRRFEVALGRRRLASNGYGWTDFQANRNPFAGVGDDELTPVEYDIDPRALAELDRLLLRARSEGTLVLGYFYPYYRPRWAMNIQGYRVFRQRMLTLFRDEDVVWDMNEPVYDDFRSDSENYMDRGHLNYAGATFVAKEIDQRLQMLVSDGRLPSN